MMKKLVLTFLTILCCTAVANAQIVENVKYIDGDGVEQTCISATEITNSSSTLSAGWYVVLGNNVQTGSLTCNGEVHLILADGAKLTATGGRDQAGIKVSGEGNSLTIYGQTTQSGQLEATGGNFGAGIGGGDNGSGSNITIYGGTITANGGERCPGIGGGYGAGASNIIIPTSFLVKEIVNDKGSIHSVSDYKLVVNDGTDLAGGLAGIKKVVVDPITYIDENGVTRMPHADVRVLRDNAVTLGAVGTETWYVALGGIEIKNGLDIKGTVHLILGDMNEEGEELMVGRPSTNRPGIRTEGATLVIYGLAASPGELAAYGGIGATGENNGSAGIGGGPKAAGGTVIINGGTVTAEGGMGGAGIGGGGDNDGTGGMGGTVIINGGTVTATGKYYGAGIGGGRQASGGTVTINGGIVTATSSYGAGIGGGSSVSYGDLVSGGTVTINGGTVKASASGLFGSGIGAGGKNGIGAKLTINGGTVTAQGGYQDDGSKFVDIGGYLTDPNVWVAINGGALTFSNIEDKEDKLTENNINGNIIITGGIFSLKPQDGWMVPDCSVVPNEDEETKVKYPWAIADNRLWTHTVSYGENITVSPAFPSGIELGPGRPITFTAADRTADGYDFFGFYKESTFETPITTGVSGQTYTDTVMYADISVYAKYRSLINEQVAAIEAINTVATTAKAEIDAASSYPTAAATKEQYNEEIELAVANAASEISNASTIAEVDEVRSKYTLIINGILTKAKEAIETINDFEKYRENVITQIDSVRVQAIKEIEATGVDAQIDELNKIVDDAVSIVENATTKEQIDDADSKILIIFSLFHAGKEVGVEEGKAVSLGTMGTKQDGPAIIVTDQDDKEIILYSPKKVQYIKVSDLTKAEEAIETINDFEKYRENIITQIDSVRVQVIKEIEATGIDARIDELNEIVDDAVSIVENATTKEQIDDAGSKILIILSLFHVGKEVGVEEGKATAFGTMGTKQNGPAVIVTDQDGNEIILYSPKSVEYIKVNE